MEKTLIIATRNSGKTKEFKKLFADFGYEIKDLTDYPELPEIEETGTTFEENARLKAEQIAEITGQVVIGDDSDFVLMSLVVCLAFGRIVSQLQILLMRKISQNFCTNWLQRQLLQNVEAHIFILRLWRQNQAVRV